MVKLVLMMEKQSTILAKIEADLHMAACRRRYVYASAYAGWLDRAAKRLVKVEDLDLRVELFLKIVLRTLKLLRAVDDSNGSLQSVLWEGSWCFEVWKTICRAGDENTLKTILAKVLVEDVDGLAEGVFFQESELPIAEPVLRNLLAHVLKELMPKRRSDQERMIAGCLGWIAQLKDETAFDTVVKHAKVGAYYVWRKRFNLLCGLGKYSDAAKVARDNNKENPHYVRELMLQIFERSGDRALLMKTALQMARSRITIDEFKRVNQLLNDDERSKFIEELQRNALKNAQFDVTFCEILFAVGELRALHAYAVARYPAIFEANACTGMVPLGKKLYKAGDALASCIFLRGAIYYLMDRNNSKYYGDVHSYLAILAQAAQAVSDWETVEPQTAFDANFARDFANRRSFWN